MEAECPPKDLEKAQSLLEEGIDRVKEDRKIILATKRSTRRKVTGARATGTHVAEAFNSSSPTTGKRSSRVP